MIVSELIDRTDRMLRNFRREPRNRLAADITDTQTNLTLAFAQPKLTPGDMIAVDAELIYVWVVGNDGAPTDVERGWAGTEAVAHAVGAGIIINPRFPRDAISDALADEIRSWPNSLFQVKTADLAADGHTRGFDLAGLGDFTRVLDVMTSGADITAGSWTSVRFRQVSNIPTAGFPSGRGVMLDSPAQSYQEVRVVAAAPFDLDVWAEDAALDDPGGVGLDPHMLDIPPLGAAAALVGYQEVERSATDAQPEPRQATEVPPGYLGAIAGRMRQRADQRISDESARLKDLYPIRMSV